MAVHTCVQSSLNCVLKLNEYYVERNIQDEIAERVGHRVGHR